MIPRTGGGGGARWALLPWGLGILPLAILILFVCRNAVDIPTADEWTLLRLIEKSYEGDLSVRDLWELHNEHRPAFARLILVALARASGWNTYWELAANLLLATGTFLVLACGFAPRPDGNRSAVDWRVPLLSILLFSMRQHEAWMQGWYLEVHLNVLSVVTGLRVLGVVEYSRARLAAGLVLGVVASYSYAAGLSYWGIGFLLVRGWRCPSARVRAGALVLWACVSAVVVGSYAVGFESPSHRPSPAYGLFHPIEFTRYVFTYLGSPLTPTWPLLAGASGFVLFLALLSGHGVLRTPGCAGDGIRRVAALGVYSLITAVVTAIGRAGMGVDQGAATRYVTFSTLLWVAVVLCIPATRTGRSHVLRISARTMVLFLALVAARISWRSRVFLEEHRALCQGAPRICARLADETFLARIARCEEDTLVERRVLQVVLSCYLLTDVPQRVESMRDGFRFLSSHRLSVFR